MPRNPPEAIRVMMMAMAEDHGNDPSNWNEVDCSDTTSKHDGSEPEDDEAAKSPRANIESVASTSSNSSVDLGNQNPILGIDTILGAYFGQPMLAAMASFNAAPQRTVNSTSDDNLSEKHEAFDTKPETKNGKIARQPVYRRLRRTRVLLPGKRQLKIEESTKQAAESFRKLCDSLVETVPKAAKSFEDACRLQSEYFRLQINLATFATQMQQINSFHQLK